MRRWIRQQTKQQLFNIHRLGTRFGVHILPVHYYSSLPDLLELERTRGVWARKSELPGLDIDLDEQVRDLETICLPYQAEYSGNHVYRYAVAHGFGPGYGYIEAQALHAAIRHFKPRRVIEVGSGVSTRCMVHALERNQAETGESFSIACIEPYPSQPLQYMEGIELVARPVQQVGFDEGFSDLGENDFLFIDSSHSVKPGSDVNYLILEILPRLRPGVVVHFHDIYLPYDYPPSVLKTFFHWMETSLVRAFLIQNSRAKIIFCQSLLHYDRQDALERVFPEYRPQPDDHGIVDDAKPFSTSDLHFPSSLYLRIQ